MKRTAFPALLALCLLLSGCGTKLLERSYSSVAPHSASYRESGDSSVLRANNYPELVNAVLMLIEQRAEDGTIRFYGKENSTQAAQMACAEVQQETAIGAYLLDYITYFETEKSRYCEITLHFSYRVPAQIPVVDATTSDAIPELASLAWSEGRDRAAIRVGTFTASTEEIAQTIEQTRLNKPAAAEEMWEINFFPNAEAPGIVEILFVKPGK